MLLIITNVSEKAKLFPFAVSTAEVSCPQYTCNYRVKTNRFSVSGTPLIFCLVCRFNQRIFSREHIVTMRMLFLTEPLLRIRQRTSIKYTIYIITLGNEQDTVDIAMVITGRLTDAEGIQHNKRINVHRTYIVWITCTP